MSLLLIHSLSATAWLLGCFCCFSALVRSRCSIWASANNHTFRQRRRYSNYLVRFSFTLVATLSRRAPEACQHVVIVTAAHFRFFSTVDRFSPSKFPTSLLRTCRREQSLCSDGENMQFYCTASTASCRSSRHCHVSAPTALPTQDSSIYSIRPFHEAARFQRCATKSLGFVSSPESVSCKSCYLKLT
jgi:hypothetical protein